MLIYMASTALGKSRTRAGTALNISTSHVSLSQSRIGSRKLSLNAESSPSPFVMMTLCRVYRRSLHFHFLDNVLLLIKTGIGDLSQRLLHSRGRSRRDWFPIPAMHASAADRLSLCFGLLRPRPNPSIPPHSLVQMLHACVKSTKIHGSHRPGQLGFTSTLSLKSLG